ncbi:MAG: hypothetical protein M3Y59_12145 [Myxococcota bacterium]|nr:hypothetical protein [Myxococcota bacterium]
MAAAGASSAAPCGEGETCGNDNVCVDAEPESRVKWLTVLREGHRTGRDLDADNNGGIVVAEKQDEVSQITRYSGAGTFSWRAGSPENEVDYREVAPTPDGSRSFATGNGPCMSCGGVFDEFSSEGKHVERHGTRTSSTRMTTATRRSSC